MLTVSPKKKATRKQRSDEGSTSLPQSDDTALPAGSVLSPTGQADTDTSSGGGKTDQGSSGPIQDLTKTLTGGGGSEPTSGPTVPELPDPGQVVEDLTDPLLP